MTVRGLFRKTHRWLGLLMALQIIAWMASGLWFSIFPIEEIRGEHLTRPAERLEVTGLDGLASPAVLEAALDQHFDGSPWTLSSARWVRQDGQLYWRVSGESAGDAFTRLVGAGSHAGVCLRGAPEILRATDRRFPGGSHGDGSPRGQSGHLRTQTQADG